MSRRVGAVVAALALTGIVLRVVLVGSEVGALDGDEAAWGTMARHVLDGEVSAFFWGQNYGGTQETLLTAAVFALAGTSVATLRVVPVCLFAVAALLTWRVGIRTVGEPYARLGASAFWAWSPYVLWKSTRAHGFYGAGLVLGLAVLLLTLRLAERPGRRDGILLGLTFGLGWWATPQAVMLAAPAAGWLAWRRPDLLRHAWLPGAAAVVGALPWIGSNLRHDWWSLSGPPQGGTALDRLHNLAATNLPSALGLRLPFSVEWVVHPVGGALLYVLALAALAWTVLRQRRRLGPLVAVLVSFPVFYAASPYAWMITEPRYLVFLVPVLALLLVAAGGTPHTALTVACVLGVLSAVGVAQLVRDNPPTVYVDGVPMPPDLDPVLRVLEKNDVRHAYATYWIAWRIVFESGERTIVVPSAPERTAGDQRPPEHGRHPSFYAEVVADEPVAQIHVPGTDYETRERPRLLAAGFRAVRAGRYVVYLPPAGG